MHWLYEAELILLMVVIAGFILMLGTHGFFMLRNRVPFVRLPWGALPKVVQALDVKPADKVVDLGCGDGRVLAGLQRAFPEASYVGYENDWMVWLASKWRATRGVRLVRGEIAAVDLSKYDKIYAYLGPKLMAELEPRFEAELPAGARVVSIQFPLPGRQPDEVVELPDSASHAACLYVYNY